MDLITIILIIVALFDLLLAFTLFIKASPTKANKVFGSLVFLIFFWCLTMIFYRLAGPGSVLFWAKLLHVAAALIPPLFLYFALIFPKTDHVSLTKKLSILVVTLGILALILHPSLLVAGAQAKSSLAEPEYFLGPLYLLYILHIIGLYAVAYFALIKKFLKTTGLTKMQLQYILIGATLTGWPAFVTNLVMPFQGDFSLNWAGQVFTLFLVASLTYAIVKHRFMNIRLALRVALLKGATAVFMVLVIYDLLVVYQYFRVSFSNTDFWVIATVIAILSVLIHEPLQGVLKDLVDKTIFQKEHSREEQLRRLSKELSDNLNLDQLLGFISQALKEILEVGRVGFVLKVSNNHNQNNHNNQTQEEVLVWGFEGWGNYDWKADPLLFEHLKVNPSILVLDELKRRLPSVKDAVANAHLQKVADTLQTNELAVLVPLPTTNGILGILAISEKLSNEAFSSSDIATIETLSYQAATAIQNAHLFSQTERFNEKLQKEVDKATATLKKQYQELKTLDRMKDELISVASHELRTPMTSIKSFLWMILNRKKETVVDPKAIEYLSKAYQSSDRMIKLVEDMLTVSKLEGGKFELKLKAESLELLITSVVDELSVTAQEKKINLGFEQPKTALPLVKIDPDRIREVLVNLIGNALKYTDAGGKVAVSAKKNKGMVEVSVTDTGKGIPKEDLPRLFKKFGRLEGPFVSSAETGGTGLGLYIVKGVVELHGGKIWVESVSGQGATFTFSLPVAKEGDKKQPVQSPDKKASPLSHLKIPGVITRPEQLNSDKST